jgi:hypothetical protein
MLFVCGSAKPNRRQTKALKAPESTMSELPLTLTYRPTLGEQLEAARYYRTTTRKYHFYRLLSLLCVGVATWAIFVSGIPVMAIIWLALAAFTWFDPMPLFLIWIGARGSAKAPPYEATLNQQGIAFNINGQKVSREWGRYRRLLQTPNLFVLIYGSWAYSILPRRAMGDAEAQERLRKLIEEKIEQNRRTAEPRAQNR